MNTKIHQNYFSLSVLDKITWTTTFGVMEFHPCVTTKTIKTTTTTTTTKFGSHRLQKICKCAKRKSSGRLTSVLVWIYCIWLNCWLFAEALFWFGKNNLSKNKGTIFGSFCRNFLVACTRLYKSISLYVSVGPSVGRPVGRLVRRSVRLSHFTFFSQSGLKSCVCATYGDRPCFFAKKISHAVIERNGAYI